MRGDTPSLATVNRVLRTYCVLWMIFVTGLHATQMDAEEYIQYTIISGVPFRIRLPETVEIISLLPRCMQLSIFKKNATDPPVNYLQGLCLQTDLGLLLERSRNSNELTISSNTIFVSLAAYKMCAGHRVKLTLQLWMETAIVLPEPVLSYVTLDISSSNGPGNQEPLSCHRRVPTVAILYLCGNSPSQLALPDRCSLWNVLAKTLLAVSPEAVNVGSNGENNEGSCTIQPYIRHGFRLFNKPECIVKNLLTLATAEASPVGSNKEQCANNSLTVMYQIGCGSVSPEALKPLAIMEKHFAKGLVELKNLFGEDNARQQSVMRNIQIIKWLVGDLVAVEHQTPVRGARVGKSAAKSTVRIAEVQGLLDEGSGFLPGYRISAEPGSHGTFYPSFENFPHAATRLQPISPVKITVHQITNVQIPQKTFEKFQEVVNSNLLVNLYRPADGNLSESEIRSPNTPVERFGAIVSRDPQDWISFDSNSKIVRLRPQPQHVGNHQLVLCAVAPTQPRACEPFYVTVRRPAPFRKNFILRIPPGIYWCYRIPIYWFEELKATSFESLELSVNGDSPFSWDLQTAEVCVVTLLRAEQIITLFFYASNNKIAQSVEIEFRLSAKAPPVQRMISSARLRLTLQWPQESKSYQLQELNRINASLAQALRVRVNPEVSATNLFIYDIIHFFSTMNDSSPARLELEWVFLPQGLPVELDRDGVGNIDQLRQIPRLGTLTGLQTSYLDRPSGLLTLPEVLKLCQSASIDGAEAALKSTADSFRPFKLESVHLLELENSACQKAKQFASKSASTDGTSLTPWGLGEIGNMKLMPEVISNFTVTAGVSFKKVINPEKATPLQRIQFIELVDIRGTKLGDTAWLGLTSDNSRLFGLPLKHHIRKQPYVFSLQIYSVDQKTPISVGFTVEVQDWFGADAEGRSNDLSPSRLPNHRVRLRIMPATTGTNWGVKPIHSLDYRWHLATAIDKFLRPHCPPPCNPDVGIWEINKHEGNTIFVVWAQLSLLMENTKLDSTDAESNAYRSGLISGTSTHLACPWEKLNRLQNLLTFAPSVVSVEKNMGLVTGYTGHGQMFLAPWAAPSASFRNHLATAGLGTVEAAVVDRMGLCARGQENKSDVHAEVDTGDYKSGLSHNDSNSSIQTFTIYTGECFRYKVQSAEKVKQSTKHEINLFDIMGQRIGTSSWIGLEEDKVTVYGILMGNAVQPITYRFKIASSSKSPDGVYFAVHVAGSNPLLPTVYNHRVIMRFGTETSQRWTGGHSLADRWRLVSALDTFLRPQCATNLSCKDNMDILLLTFNYQANGFTVIWSEKSLLMKTSTESTASVESQLDPLVQHWNKWSKQSHQQWSSRASSVRHLHRRHLAMKTVNASAPLERTIRSGSVHSGNTGCPERDIIYLERRLLGDSGFGLLPLPELAHHLRVSGVGFLKEVQVERLGPCAKSLANVPLYIPGSGISVQSSTTGNLEQSSSATLPASVSSFGPTETKDRQRLILLGILLPVCVAVICLLVAILGLVWYRKRGKSTDRHINAPSKSLLQSHNIANPETERMLKQDSEAFKSTDMALSPCERVHTATLRSQPNGAGTQTLNYPEMVEPNCTPPTKPLILPHERPPLKPPEYNLAYTDSPMTSPPQYHNGTPTLAQTPLPVIMNPAAMAGPSPRPVPKPYYGARPNPYRNLPPPIETKPGMPSLAAQIPYAPYKRTSSLHPDMSNTLHR